jgi:DNA repair protein RecO (recombination protein O)
MEEKTEGILLRSIPYLGNQKILKVFAPAAGLVSFMSKKNALAPFTSPFLAAEWVYKKGKEEIHSLKDATLLDSFADLRKSYDTLSAAGQIAQDLLRTQLPGKKAPALYSLALAYFAKLPLFARPEILSSSFRLKLLLHEGLLALHPHCTVCGGPALALRSGESFCSAHANAPPLAPAEWETLHTLAYARQFAPLHELRISGFLLAKIHAEFEDKLRNY